MCAHDSIPAAHKTPQGGRTALSRCLGSRRRLQAMLCPIDPAVAVLLACAKLFATMRPRLCRSDDEEGEAEPPTACSEFDIRNPTHDTSVWGTR
jgi:hypothetical protein